MASGCARELEAEGQAGAHAHLVVAEQLAEVVEAGGIGDVDVEGGGRRGQPAQRQAAVGAVVAAEIGCYQVDLWD